MYGACPAMYIIGIDDCIPAGNIGGMISCGWNPRGMPWVWNAIGIIVICGWGGQRHVYSTDKAVDAVRQWVGSSEVRCPPAAKVVIVPSS